MSTLSARWRDGGMEAKCPLCGEYLATTPEFWNPRSGLTRCRACWAEYYRLRQLHYNEDEAVRACSHIKSRMLYAMHRDDRLAYNRIYRANHPEQRLAYNTAYKALKRGDPMLMAQYKLDWPDGRLTRNMPPMTVAERRRQWRDARRRSRAAA